MQTALPFLALMSNALIWGTIWWPLRQLQAQGVHPVLATALVYVVLFTGLLLARPGAARIARLHPLLLLLAFTAGTTNVLFNWAVATSVIPALPDWHWGWALGVLGVAVLIMLSNWTLQYGAARLAATTAAVVMLSEVVFASASNVLIDGAALPGRLLLGGALVLSAAVIAAIESKLP